MSTSFRARFQQRIAKAPTGASEDLWRYREAASVLAYFDYETLQPFGEVSPSSTARTELLADCDAVYLAAGMPRWTLRTPIRQTALHRLLEKQSVDAALAANPNRADTFAQKLLERLLKNYQAAPRVVRASAGFGSPEENQALLQVIDWLSGVPEFEGKLPRLEDVKQRIAQDHLLEPFRQLVGSHFAGRSYELKRLADYVGVHDAYSTAETVQRFVEGIFSIKQRPPLFVNGPGGSGKSTLIAKFILDHATVEQSSRFPYAYLDFDRVGLIAEEPITLLFEIMRQLAIQFPAANEQYMALALAWSTRLTQQTSASEDTDTTPNLPQSLRFENRDSFISEFASFVTSLQTDEQPLLLVLDTFEEVQFRSTAYTDEIFDFLNQLQQQVPRLRTVLSGRAEIESKDYKFNRVVLGNFDHDAAISYLAGRGLTDTQVADRIYGQVGGSPLVLRLAADVAKLEKVDEKGIEGLGGWLSMFQKQSIEAVLYKRILKHVYNERIEALAYPGLVLRTITPEVLEQVLGPGCEVPISSLADARDLVKLMKARLSTILIPEGSDYVLVHRPDMRSILLSDLKTTAEKKPEIAAQLTDIHKKAIDLYAKSSDPAQRAEEIYHRLALGFDRKVLNKRWMEGLTPFLNSSTVRELPPAGQVYLAARLKLELPDELWSSAEDEDWILYASRLVDQTLDLQKTDDALAVLRQRKHLWTSKSFRPVVMKVANAVFSDYANEYEDLRNEYPGGDRRTGLMNALVSRITRSARELALEPSYAPSFFTQGGAGQRVVGLAIADANPAPEHVEIAIIAIRKALSPFEQYHALRLARTLLDKVTPTQRGALLNALQIQEGTPIPESDASRMFIKTDLLRRFSIFSIEVLQARTGDCLMLHYGTAEDPGLALIDGGPANVYQPYLKPRLAQLRKARRLDPNAALVIDLLMISHIDDDHIGGVLQLTKELIEAKYDKRSLPLNIKDVWHNAFDDILGDDPKELMAAVTAQFGSAALFGDGGVEGLDPYTGRVLASISQGFSLRDAVRHLNVPLNQEFKGKLVLAKAKGKKIDMGKNLKFTVIGPQTAEVATLQKQHQAFLKMQDKRAAVAAFTDNSVANLSNIVVLAEVGGKRMLLTGDARGDIILVGLEFAGLVKSGGKLQVDVLKVPGYGSTNTSYIFFETITADHYIISGNGEHGFPDRETFEMLMNAREGDDFTIHLTYPIDEIDANLKHDREMGQAKERKRQEGTFRKARPDWSPKNHSLGYLINKNPTLAKKIRVVEEDRPHVINLQDELGF